MAFDYAKTGLPDKPEWRAAVEICHAWLTKNMIMFGPERIENFMKNQPLTAANLIMENSEEWSEDSVTMALLGPAKADVFDEKGAFHARAGEFGEKTKALFKAMTEEGHAPDAEQRRDMVRLFLVEGLSTMNDQMIGRKKADGFHEKRWIILRDLERDFSAVKGQNPALDDLFEKAAKESRATLEALDFEREKSGKGLKKNARRNLEP